MKIISSFLGSVSGIETYPLISLLIFFVFFIAVTWYVVRLPKRLVERMADFPNEPDSSLDITTITKNKPGKI